MNQIKPMNQFISVLPILTILIQHKQLNNGSYSLYFDSKILSHYPIHKLKDMADKPTNFDTIHTSNTNCAIMYLMKKHGREAYKFGYYHELDQANESESISALQISIIVIQNKQVNYGSYHLYFGPNILYGIDEK